MIRTKHLVYQAHQKNRYGEFVKTQSVEKSENELSLYQNFLFKRAVYGLTVYTEEEQKLLSHGKRARIFKVHQRAQKVINIFKQEVCNAMSNSILSQFKWNSSIMKEVLNTPITETDEYYVNRIKLKELGITKDRLIDRFVREGILPQDFHNIVDPTDN